MAKSSVVDALAAGLELCRADVLTVAEIVASHLAEQHDQGGHHGDVGPHTVLLDVADPASGRVRDATLLEPWPAGRPLNWPQPPEGRPGPAGDVYCLGQVLRSLDAHSRSRLDDVGLPAFVQRMLDPDPVRRLSVRELLAAFDEGQIRAPSDPIPPPVDQAVPASAAPIRVLPEPASESHPEPASTWPPAVAAATVFVLVLAGGLWWTGHDDGPAVPDTQPPQAAVVDAAEPVTDPTPPAPDPTEPTDPTEPRDPTEPTDEAVGPSGDDDVQAPISEGGSAEEPGATDRPSPGETLAPDISGTPDDGPHAVAAQQAVAEGSTEFDQAWCRSHGSFVARVQTVNYHATICRDGDAVNYHGLNLIDGLAIRTPATEHGAGWTGHGEEGVTYEVSREVFEVRQGETVLASEDVATYIDPTQDGDFRPWDLHVTEPISYPACRGAAIVVLDTFDNLQGVNLQVQESLDAHPGAGYLNTDSSCDSLGQPSHERGNQFITYYWAGYDEEEICSLIGTTGTHGLLLEDDVDPREQFHCG